MALLTLFSCHRSEDQIRQYRVAKNSQDDVVVTPAATTSSGQVWFFKLLTRTDSFEKYSNDFAAMIIGADVSGEVPKYSLPEQWTESAGPGPIYRTIQVSEDGSDAALTLTPLPAPASDPAGYLKGNVDRWRRQLGLEPLASPNWLQEAMEKSEIVSIPKGDQFITLVHLQGKTANFDDTELLVAIVSDDSLTGRAALARPAGAPASPKQSQVEYTLPKGWKESQGNAMRLVSLAVDNAAGPADFSVIRLPGGGDVLPNINRWRGQVKLEPIPEEELEKTLESVKVDGFEGKLALLEGAEESILAAIIEQNGVKWFFKLQGPTATVKAEQDRFRELLNSIKLNLESK